MTRPRPRLRDDRFELRLAEATDVPALLAYRRENAAHLEPYEPARTADHFTDAYWARQVDIALEQFDADLAVRLFLFEPGEGTSVLGMVSFSNIIRGAFQSCFLGYALAESQQGKGLMTGALRLGIDYMFGEMHIHRIAANYMPDNARSAAVLERLGFRIEGRAADYLLIDGRWRDHVLTSLVNPAWTPAEPA